MTNANCPLCDQPAQNLGTSNALGDRDPSQIKWECQTCGTFRVGTCASENLARDSNFRERRFLLSAYAKEGADVLIDLDLLDRLRQGGLRERTVPEKMELVLRYFASKSREYGQEVTHEPQYDYPIGWCGSSGEWSRLVATLVRMREFLNAASAASCCSVTMKGWEWLGTKPTESAKTAFVAMNFADEYKELQKAIEQAIINAGYDPLPISKDLYAGGVMDRVLARIREARFVVADYTGNRGGVYYEAGFALGLGKTVMHSCNKTQLASSERDMRLHFDVAHLKIIPWHEENLSAYTDDLEAHILAVLGRGPVKP